MEHQPERGLGVLAGLEALDRPAQRTPERREAQPPYPPSPGVQQHPLSRGQRAHLRRSGPFVALLVPIALGVASLVMLRDNTSTARGISGFLAAMGAAPLMAAFGLPMRTGSGAYVGAIAASAALWFALGAWAAQRATSDPAAGWGRFWIEYLWLVACVWVGVALSLVASNLVLGRVLI